MKVQKHEKKRENIIVKKKKNIFFGIANDRSFRPIDRSCRILGLKPLAEALFFGVLSFVLALPCSKLAALHFSCLDWLLYCDFIFHYSIKGMNLLNLLWIFRYWGLGFSVLHEIRIIVMFKVELMLLDDSSIDVDTL